jgi:quinohemoprotein ethanol dehydrogenase
LPSTRNSPIGARLFERGEIEGLCWYCHGMGGDLWRSGTGSESLEVVLDREVFDRIVRAWCADGDAGMPAYAEITDREIEGIRHYIRQQAGQGLAQQAGATAD